MQRWPAAITPDPEPEPEFVEVNGLPYTYCFEDGWPWIGDYDMNDVVVVVSVDRRSDKETGKVDPDPHQLGTEGRRCRAPECLCRPAG